MRSIQFVVEKIVLASAIVLYCALSILGMISINSQILLSIIFLAALLCLSWRNMDRGLHPCFYFLVLLTLFQGGRLVVGCLFPGSLEPMQIVSQTLIPFEISAEAQRTSLLAITLSGYIIYQIVAILEPHIRYREVSSSRLVPPILTIFILTLPFHIWKNYQYFSFVRSHGGYLSVYLQNDELLNTVSSPVRMLSSICTASFLICICYLEKKRHILAVLYTYLGVTSLELLMGFRGKALTLIICVYFLWKVKTRSSFRLKTLAVAGVCLAFIAYWTAAFRQNLDDVDLFSFPTAFLTTQGISLGVTETAVAFPRVFSGHNVTYFINGFSSAVPAFSPREGGRRLDGDISYFLGPEATLAGFSCGNAYLAEAYVFLGIPGVILESIIVGLLLSWIAKNFRDISTPFALIMMLNIIYLPRSSLAEALGRTTLGFIQTMVLLIVARLTGVYFRRFKIFKKLTELDSKIRTEG